MMAGDSDYAIRLLPVAEKISGSGLKENIRQSNIALNPLCPQNIALAKVSLCNRDFTVILVIDIPASAA